MRRLPAWRPRHPIRLAAGVVLGILALATAGHHMPSSGHGRAAAGGTAVVVGEAVRAAVRTTAVPALPVLSRTECAV